MAAKPRMTATTPKTEHKTEAPPVKNLDRAGRLQAAQASNRITVGK